MFPLPPEISQKMKKAEKDAETIKSELRDIKRTLNNIEKSISELKRLVGKS